LSTPAPQPDPARTELTSKSAEVGAECVRAGGRKCATLATNVGHRSFAENMEEKRRFLTTERECQQAYTTVASKYLNERTGLMDEFHDARDLPLSESLIVHRGSATSNGERDRTQSWMAATTSRVNSHWKSLYGKTTLPMPDVSMMDEGNSQKIGPGFPSHKDTKRPQGRQEISCFLVERESQATRNTRPPDRRIWRIDSDIEIALDRPPERRRSPEVDLRIPPRSRLQRT